MSPRALSRGLPLLQSNFYLGVPFPFFLHFSQQDAHAVHGWMALSEHPNSWGKLHTYILPHGVSGNSCHNASTWCKPRCLCRSAKVIKKRWTSLSLLTGQATLSPTNGTIIFRIVSGDIAESSSFLLRRRTPFSHWRRVEGPLPTATLRSCYRRHNREVGVRLGQTSLKSPWSWGTMTLQGSTIHRLKVVCCLHSNGGTSNGADNSEVSPRRDLKLIFA